MEIASEIRSWVQLIFIVVAGVIGLVVFFQNTKQRRLENSLRLINWFYTALEEGDISAWRNLFVSASEIAGAKPGYYVGHKQTLRPLSDYFEEAPPDNGAFDRISQNLEIICHEIGEGTADIKFIWYELGQLLYFTHYWLSCTEGHTDGVSLLESSFPNISAVYNKHKEDFGAWPHRIIDRVE